MHRIALLHANLFYTISALVAALALWGLAAALVGQGAGARYRAALWVAVLLIAAEGLLGAILLLGGRGLPQAMHLVYGTIAAASLPLALGAARIPERRSSLILAATCFWVVAIAVRAWQTGG